MGNTGPNQEHNQDLKMQNNTLQSSKNLLNRTIIFAASALCAGFAFFSAFVSK